MIIPAWRAIENITNNAKKYIDRGVTYNVETFPFVAARPLKLGTAVVMCSVFLVSTKKRVISAFFQ